MNESPIPVFRLIKLTTLSRWGGHALFHLGGGGAVQGQMGLMDGLENKVLEIEEHLVYATVN